MKVYHKIRGIWLTLALTLLCLTSFGQGFTVLQFGLSNAPFWQNPSTNRVIRLQPIQPFVGNYQWVTSDVTGNAYYSNSSAATYSGLIMAPPSPSLNFNITVTATNLGLINVSNLISIPGNAIQTIPSGSAAWPIYVSDSRYAFNSNAASGGNAPLSANQSTNLVASAIPTNLWSNTTNGWISGLVTLLGVNTNAYIAGARINMTSNGPVVTIAVNTNQFIFSNDLWTASNYLANNAGISLTTATNITQGILTISNANVVYTNSLYGLTNLINAYSNSDLATYAISNGPTVAGPVIVVAPASKGIINSNASGGVNWYFSTGSPPNQWFFQLMGYNGTTPTMGSNWIYAPFISGDGGGGPVFGQLTNTGASLLQSNALAQVTNVVNGTAVTTTGFTNGFGTNDYTFSKVGQQFFAPTNFDIKGGSNANYLLLTGGSNYFQTNVVFNQNGLSTNEVTTNTTLNGNTSFSGATNFIWSTNLIGFGLAGTSALTNAVFEWQSAMNLYSNWYNGYIVTNNGSVWQVYTTAGGTLIATSPNLGVQAWTVNSGPTTPPTVSCWGHYEYGDRAKQVGIWSFTNVVQVIGASNGLAIANLGGRGTNTYLTNLTADWNTPAPGSNFVSSSGSAFNFQAASWGMANTNIGSGFGAALLSGSTNKILLSGGSVIAGGIGNLISGGFNNGNAILGGESNQISAGNDGDVIGGGIQNNVPGAFSFIGSGYLNYCGGSYASIPGGAFDTNLQSYGFVGGGLSNMVSSQYGGILGGLFNQVISTGGAGANPGNVILAGKNNLISNGSWSVGLGQNIVITNKNDFVWSDGTPVNTITNSQVILEATNGVAINTNYAGTNALNVSGSVNSSSGFFVNGQPVQTAGNFVAQQSGNSTNQTVVTSPYVQGTNFVIGQNTNLFSSTNIIRIYQAGTGFVTNGAYEWNSGMGVFSNSTVSAIISNNAVAPFVLITNGFTLYSSATLVNSAWSSVGVGVVGTASSQYGAYNQHNGMVDIGFITSTNLDSKIISSVGSASNSIISQLRSTNTFMTPVSGVTAQGDILVQDVRSNLLKDSLVALSSVITNNGPATLKNITNIGTYYGNAAGLTNFSSGAFFLVTNLFVYSTNSTLDTNHQLVVTTAGSTDANGTYTFQRKVGISYLFTNVNLDCIKINGTAFTTSGVLSNSSAVSLYTWSGAITNNAWTITGGNSPVPNASVVGIITTNNGFFAVANSNLWMVPTNNNYFVAPWGNDAMAAASNGFPFLTINSAASNALFYSGVGQTIFVWPGTYPVGINAGDVQIIGLGPKGSVTVGAVTNGLGPFTVSSFTNNVAVQNITFRSPVYIYGTSNNIIGCTINCYDNVDGIVDGGGFDYCDIRDTDIYSGYDTVNVGVNSKYNHGHIKFTNCRMVSDASVLGNPARNIVSGSCLVTVVGGSLTAINGSNSYTTCIAMGGNGNGETNAQVTISGVALYSSSTNANGPAYQAYWPDNTTNCTITEYGNLITTNYSYNGQNGAAITNVLQPALFIANPIPNGGYWTNTNAVSGTIIINATGSTLTSCMNFTNLVSTEWFQYTNSTAPQQIIFRMFSGEYLVATQKSGTMTINSSSFRP